MKKYIIEYNAGYGDEFEVVEAESLSHAEDIAYETWNDIVQSAGVYCAHEYTRENREDYLGEEFDEEDEK